MNNITKIIIGILIIVAIAGYGGFKYGQSHTPVNNGQRGQFNMARGKSAQGGLALRSPDRSAGGFSGGGGMFAGDIIKKDNQSLTIQLRDGGSKIIWFSTSTEVSKMAVGSLNEVNIGQAVTIIGATNSDGSVVAKTIQLRPALKP